MQLITESEVSVCEIASQRLERRLATGETLRVDDIAAELGRAVEYLGVPFTDSEQSRAIRYLETKYVVSQVPGLDGSELKNSRIPDWVPTSKPAADWPFWYRYQRLLKGRLSPAVLQELDTYTDRILTKLGNPRLEPAGHPTQWDVRGMVAGHVQSGKTSNYIGLVCKAADAGYKLIIVLTGIHENLRVQTQERIDEGFLGKKAAGNPKDPHEPTGVGRITVPGAKHQPVAFWGTTQAPGGDFRDGNIKGFGVELRPDLPPVVLVVKKNASVLRRLLTWVVAQQLDALPGKVGKYEDRLHDVPHFYRRGCPLLVIDDEADQASVDTIAGNIDDAGVVNTDHDPTQVNRLIRSLLRSFERSAYVGYTATPFANILIHDGGFTKTHGDDLFPRDFIVNLPTPAVYVGPTAIFGRRVEEEGDGPSTEGLESVLVEEVRDHAVDPDDIRETRGWMPPVHPQTHPIGELPESLRRAIDDWILAGAGLVCRGRGHEHHSMLIHVTRFQSVMDRLTTSVDRYWDDTAARVTMGDPGVLARLKARWESSFCRANLEVVRARPQEGSLLAPLAWVDLLARDEAGHTMLARGVSGVRVSQVHGGTNSKPLVYDKARQLKVIAIGGNKLSRGLTLENLTVSYFLRTSRMYDTLMQMGRWFGYRPGLLDLCRLYMPRELRNWFEHMADATEELRGEFDRMAAQGAIPKEFGVRVRSHPVMTVTSNVKMRHGTPILVSFSDTRPESIVFDVTPSAVARNWAVLGGMVEDLGTPDAIDPVRDRPGRTTPYSGFLWEGVRGSRIVQFLGRLVTPSGVTVAHGPRVAQYIDSLIRKQELIEWTVFLRQNNDDTRHRDVLPHGITLGRSSRKRSQSPSSREQRGKLNGATFATKILIDSDYETVDISGKDYDEALEMKRKQPGNESSTQPGGYVRLVRPATRGLLLVYPVQPYDPATKTGPLMERQDIALDPDVPLVGFAVSFPRSTSGQRVEYVVGNVYLNEEIERMRKDEELED